MDGTILAQAVKDAMDDSSEFADNQTGPSVAFVDLLCDEIVKHIQTLGTVSTITTHAPLTINVTGTAAAQTNPAPVIGSGIGAPGSIQ